MRAVDSPQEERSSVCNKIETRRIMATPEAADVEFFCDVVSGILDRIMKEDSQVFGETLRQEP